MTQTPADMSPLLRHQIDFPANHTYCSMGVLVLACRACLPNINQVLHNLRL